MTVVVSRVESKLLQAEISPFSIELIPFNTKKGQYFYQYHIE